MSLNPRITGWTGQVVWLVGASTGIGRATAEHLHTAGATVIVSARNAAALAQFTHGRERAEALVADVTDRAALREAATQIVARHGRIDLAMYCAGHYKPQRATAFDLDEMLRHQQVNVVGALHLLDAVLPQLLRQAASRPAGAHQPGGQRGRLPRPAECAGLRTDQGGLDQPGRDALSRSAAHAAWGSR